jgi:hypothetical protein
MAGTPKMQEHFSASAWMADVPRNEVPSLWTARFRKALRLRTPLVTLTAAGTATGPRLVADAVADIVARRSTIVESTRLVIARAALLWAPLVAARSAILSATGLTLARRPVFIGDRIAKAVRFDSRLGAVRIARTARVATGSAVALSLAASACAGRTETAWPRTARATARRAAWCAAAFVAARRAAARVWLSGQPGRLVDTDLLLWRAAV